MELKNKIMEKLFVPYEQALELRNLGFDEECFGKYFTSGSLITAKDFSIIHDDLLDAPLWQQAFDWFRVGKYLYPDIYRTGKLFSANIEDMLMGNSLCQVLKEVTYEEARLECLNKLIEICKKN